MYHMFLLHINATTAFKASEKSAKSSTVITPRLIIVAISHIASDFFNCIITPGFFLSFFIRFQVPRIGLMLACYHYLTMIHIHSQGAPYNAPANQVFFLEISSSHFLRFHTILNTTFPKLSSINSLLFCGFIAL